MLDFHFTQPGGSGDSFVGYYINSLEDMNTLAAPYGTSIVGVNIDAGFLWSKKTDKFGRPLIRTFELKEVFYESETDKLKKEIDILKKELAELKGGNCNVGEITNGSTNDEAQTN